MRNQLPLAVSLSLNDLPHGCLELVVGMNAEKVEELLRQRKGLDWKSRLFRHLFPPNPFVMNPREDIGAPL